MKILASIEVRVDSIEEFEEKYPKHKVMLISGVPFLFWCKMCPEAIVLNEIWTFVDENNQKVDKSTDRRAHIKHFLPNI